MLVTDKYAYISKFAKKDPLAKVIFTFTMLFLCLILNNIFVSIFILIFFAGFTIMSNPAVSFIKYKAGSRTTGYDNADDGYF